MKVTIVADYKDVQVFKGTMQAESQRIISSLEEGFQKKQCNILNQIDIYLQGIAKQLKGTKERGWYFHITNGNNCCRVHFNQNGTYHFELKIGSGGNFYVSRIVGGDLIMDTTYESVLNIKQRYVELIIANWKGLKESIHNGIILDLERAQNEVSEQLNKTLERNSIYDSFEI